MEIEIYDSNNIEIYHNKVNKFAYDGCHKIYLLEDDEDLVKSKDLGYNDDDIYNIDSLQDIWLKSCPLKFIRTWKLKSLIPQFASIEFWEEKGETITIRMGN